MRNVFTLLAVFLALGFSAYAQQPAKASQQAVQANNNGAQMVFVTDVIDYGTIEQNSDGVREFKFTNTGNEPLIITNAKGSCGCTVPDWPKEPIAPGEASVIKVRYATNRLGAFTKTVTVTSNSKTPTSRLTIKGKVIKVDETEGLPQKKPSLIEEQN